MTSFNINNSGQTQLYTDRETDADHEVPNARKASPLLATSPVFLLSQKVFNFEQNNENLLTVSISENISNKRFFSNDRKVYSYVKEDEEPLRRKLTDLTRTSYRKEYNFGHKPSSSSQVMRQEHPVSSPLNSPTSNLVERDKELPQINLTDLTRIDYPEEYELGYKPFSSSQAMWQEHPVSSLLNSTLSNFVERDKELPQINLTDLTRTDYPEEYELGYKPFSSSQVMRQDHQVSSPLNSPSSDSVFFGEDDDTMDLQVCDDTEENELPTNELDIHFIFNKSLNLV